MRRILLAIVFIFEIGHLSLAQNFRAGINGSVSDPTGATVADAEVKATDTGTGLVYSTLSSTAGEFAFRDLPLGTYSIVVTKPGFQVVRVEGIHVSAGEAYALPVHLNVAQQATTVEVSAASVSLDTSGTTLTTSIPATTVQDLPLNGRDFTQMIAIAPGFAGYAGGANGSVNGARANQVNWQIEGSDNNDQWWNIMAVNQGGVQSIAGTVRPLDAVEEFSLQNQPAPESGRNPGGTINLVIKSGTNQLHGSAYYFNRNEALAAQSYFAPEGSPKNKMRNQQFGFSTGGPIIRDKTFFFVTYEEQKFLIGNQALSTEPSVAYQQQAAGLLSQYGVPVNPVSLNLLNTLWPGSALQGPASANNYFNPNPENGFSHNGLVKIDHSFNDNNRLSFRWFVGQGTQTAPIGSHLSYYYQVAPIHVQNYSLIYNWTLSARLTNQAVFGVSYFNQVFSDANSSFDPVSLGLNTGVNAPNLSGAPFISIGSFDTIGLTPNSGRNDVTGHLNDALSYLVGRHQMRFGGEVRQARVDSFYNTGARGAFFFNGGQGPWSGLLNQAGYDTNIAALADFLAGSVYQSTIVRGDQERKVRMNSFALFAQDSWQITPRLNVNYGMRYDYEGPIHSGNNDLSVFNPAKGGLVVAGQQVGDIYPQFWKAFSPRAGFAYQPGSNNGLVIRGGFGIFFDTPAMVPFLDNSSSLSTPSVANNGPLGVEGNPAGSKPVYTLQQNGYTVENGLPIFPTGALSLAGNNLVNLFSVSPNFRPAYSFNYNLNVEKSLGGSAFFQVGYVGTEARHLLILRDINQAALGSGFVNTTDPLGFSYQQQTRPYFGLFPNYGVIDEIQSTGTSNYNALQATIRSSSWHGLASQFSYTWGHSLDEVTQYVGALPQNSNNLRGDYGNSDYDIRHTFTGYLLYDIPGWSHGPRWLTHGWQANTNLSFHTGLPFNVHASSDTSGTGENTTRGDIIGNPYQGVDRSLSQHQPVQWINPAAFANPANGSFGNIGRNVLRGPGYGDMDLSFFKNIPIKERLHAQFRIEMFNLFNRVNLAPPNGYLGGGFGASSDTIGDYNGAPGIGPGEPFNTQLALKLVF
ncbi:MAG: TonB-dependent receptor [Acidobacteriota bacterium]|nr:TonB-dependent receptor [Acidobacteriota bacterium]